ncbi:MAG TPA: sulfite exporter TauE/SafE family protein [Ktedonobacterales bacterium]
MCYNIYTQSPDGKEGTPLHLPILVFLLLIFVTSLIAGTLGALLGLGGGIIVVPALSVLFGVDIHFAIGASIVSVIATSSGAAVRYLRDHISNLRIGMFLEVATTTGAITGAFVGAYLGGPVLFFVFGIILLYSCVVMLQRGKMEQMSMTGALDPETLRQTPDTDMGLGRRLARRLHLDGAYYDVALKRKIAYRVQGVPLGFGLMYIAGMVSGLLGVGGGALKVPAMDIAMRIPMKASTTTSNFMIGVTAAASAGVYFSRGDINPLIAAPVALGVLLGALTGAQLLIRVRGLLIRRIFVVVLVLTALEMVLRAFGLGI